MGIFSSIKAMLVQPSYEENKATDVTYNALSESTKQIIKKNDVKNILNLEFQYQQKIGLAGIKFNGSQKNKEAVQIDDDLNKYIIQEAAKKGKQYSNDLIDKILAAEEVYLKKIGAIEK